jgi:hypothetical protein
LLDVILLLIVESALAKINAAPSIYLPTLMMVLPRRRGVCSGETNTTPGFDRRGYQGTAMDESISSSEQRGFLATTTKDKFTLGKLLFFDDYNG